MQLLNKATNIQIYSLIILFLYFSFLSHLAFSIDDGGYMYGAGWRMLSGEKLYIDYIYARPPVSPYFNALIQYILPDNYEYLNMRRFFYLEIFIYSFLTAHILNNKMKEYKIKIDTLTLSTIFFIFNAHFNNYMWHTTDGLFFMIISLWIIVMKDNKWTILSSLMFVLAVGTKQSFYPALILFPLFIALVKDKKSSIVFAFFVILWIAILGVTYNKLEQGSIQAWMELSQFESQTKAIIEAGLVTYIVHFGILMIFLGFSMINLTLIEDIRKYMKEKKGEGALLYIIKYWARVILILITIDAFLLIFMDSIFPKLMHVFISGGMVFVFISIIIRMKVNNSQNFKDDFLLITIMFSIAWMSSLSWGYKTPIFYSGIIIYVLISLSEINISKRKIVSFFFISFILVTSILSNRFEKGVNLEFISEKLKGVYIFEKEKVEDQQRILDEIEKCNTDFIVFPSHTYIHYATKTKPVSQLDWISKAEAMNKSDLVQKRLLGSNCLIIEKNYRFKNKNKKFGWNYNISGY